MLHRSKGSQMEPQPTKGNKMFEIEKYYKQYETLLNQIKEANEFWVNAILSSAKSFYSTKK